ncbi:MAG: hypothetical protein U0271_20780 [Polyangiaceae bacterium]
MAVPPKSPDPETSPATDDAPSSRGGPRSGRRREGGGNPRRGGPPPRQGGGPPSQGTSQGGPRSGRGGPGFGGGGGSGFGGGQSQGGQSSHGGQGRRQQRGGRNKPAPAPRAEVYVTTRSAPAPAPPAQAPQSNQASRDAEPSQPNLSGRAPRREAGRIVVATAVPIDDRERERERYLDRLKHAEGRPAITRIADEFLKAGFELPSEDQEVHLQLLQHADEARVRDAIASLSAALERGEPPFRQTMLDSRLRRLEEFAEDSETRTAAGTLRRRAAGVSAPAES